MTFTEVCVAVVVVVLFFVYLYRKLTSPSITEIAKVLDYLRSHTTATAGEIATDLKMDIAEVASILEELKEEKMAKVDCTEAGEDVWVAA